MKKTKTTKAKAKRARRMDFSQNALRVVMEATSDAKPRKTRKPTRAS